MLLLYSLLAATLSLGPLDVFLQPTVSTETSIYLGHWVLPSNRFCVNLWRIYIDFSTFSQVFRLLPCHFFIQLLLLHSFCFVCLCVFCICSVFVFVLWSFHVQKLNWIELNWIKLNYITLHYIIMRLTVCNSHKNFIRLSRSRRFRQTGNVASIGETQEVHTEFR